MANRPSSSHAPASQAAASQAVPVTAASSSASTRSGALAPLPSPGAAVGTPPGSPGSSSNRFGLALNFMGRRPRTSTNPSSMRPGGMASPVSPFGPGGSSPARENPPSPSGERERERSGYGFPSLRRQISRRGQTSDGTPAAAGGGSGAATGSTSHSRVRRSSSQPPVTDGYVLINPPRQQGGSSSRPRTATAGLDDQATPTAAATGDPFSSSVSLAAPPSNEPEAGPSRPVNGGGDGTVHHLRLVPHLESSRSLHFDPVNRDIIPFFVLRVGRFTDRSSNQHSAASDSARIAFKSKVVSRSHAEIWCDEAGKFFIRDSKSSSGTFLNHIRLSGPGAESRPFPLKDGDVLQLGVDYQGGTEEIYRCVKMRVELNREWQRGMNAFNQNALAQLRALGGGSSSEVPTAAGGAAAATAGGLAPPTSKAMAATASTATASGSVTDCCICLYPVTVCQALFIAPCSHVTHFKCIRPLINQNYPGFSCPLCRTYADLEADVEVEDVWQPTGAAAAQTVDEEPELEAAESSGLEEEDSGASSTSEVAQEPEGSALFGAPLAAASTGVSSAIPIAHAASDDRADVLFAEAATPPNSTFLSTLADSGAPLPRFRQQQQPLESLDQAVTRLNVSGTPGGGSSREDLDETAAVPAAAVAEVASGGTSTEEEDDDDEGSPLAGAQQALQGSSKAAGVATEESQAGAAGLGSSREVS